MAQHPELESARDGDRLLGEILAGADTGEREDEQSAGVDTELLTGPEFDLEGLFGDEGEDEDELESLLGADAEEEYFADAEAEEFFGGFGKRTRGVRRFVRRGVRILRPFAKVAVPLVGTAVGGPLGGVLGSVAASMLESAEPEFDDEQPEPMSAGRAQAEVLAAQAATSESEAEAEALVGAAAWSLLNRKDRRAIRAVHADLVRGAATLAELLHRHRATRPYTGVVPAIVDRTARTLVRRGHEGQRVTRKAAAKVMAGHTARVMGDPAVTQRTLAGHVRAVRSSGQSRNAAGSRSAATLRVVTPVRLPTSGKGPGRVVRVVTNVRVPPGAVLADRTARVVRADGQTEGGRG